MDESTRRVRHSDSMRQAILSALFPTFVLFILTPAVGGAQVVTNITSLPTDTGYLGTTITHTGGHLYDIGGGTRPGDGTGPILFHSFRDFSVGQSEGQSDIANFFNDSGVTTTNIIGRVTGGNPSNIDGIIRTTDFPGANLFLINQFGIVFGPHGSFEVGGSVSFSTSQYLRLFDGINSANFYADPANDVPVPATNSVFAMAPVVDFGFLSPVAPAAYGFLDAPNPSATITVQGSALSVPPGSPGNSISLVGGNVVIQDATLPDGTIQRAQLSAPNGRIQLATAASPGEFDVNTLQSLPNNPVDPASAVSFTSYGSVSLASGSSINVSGANTVFVKGGQLVLSVNDATLTTAESSAPQDTDMISLGSGSSIMTSNSGAGPGADVQITVGDLNLDGAAITTENLGDGIGGNITAHVGAMSLANIASLNSNNSSFTIGDDGNFIIGIGQGGQLTIQGLTGADSAAGSVMLTNGSSITTQTFSSKPGGDVVIAAEDVHLDASTISTTMLGPGGGGDVHITADLLTIKNGSTVTTGTSFLGEVGGDLFLNVGTLRLMGGEFGGSLIQSVNGSGDLDGDGFPDVFGLGKGGNITIQGTTQGANSAADLVVLSGSSRITSGVQSGSGGGGRISIRATTLDLMEASGITSSTSSFGTDLDGDGQLDDVTAGAGGDILVAVQNLHILPNGSTITSSTVLGNTLAVAGGTVTVEGLDAGSKAGVVLLSGQSTGIFSFSNGGVPGNLTVNAETLTITNGAVINTGSGISGPAGNVGITADSVMISAGGQIFSRTATQNAGQVTITADELTLDKGSIVTSTTSESLGRGGNVELNVIGTVSLTNGASINSQSEIFSNGRAGDITITGLSLTLANQSKITSSSLGTVADAGDAGNITIQSGSTVLLKDSSITTEAREASGGRIEINAPEMIQLTNSRISTSVRDGTGGGGNITIDPQFVILQNSQIIAQAFAGAGGAITITAASAFISDPLSIVNASSTLGISGTVNIQSPLQNVGGELTALTQEFSSAAALLAQQCAARAADGKFSTFVVAAREGLPMEPGGFLASPSLTPELLGPSLSWRDSHLPIAAVTGAFQEYNARPIQLAKLGKTCR